MKKIVRNEWYKSFFRIQNYISILLIVAFTLALSIFPAIFTSQYVTGGLDSENWESEVYTQIDVLNSKINDADYKLAELSEVSPDSMEVSILEAEKSELTEEINRLNYSLSNNIQPVNNNNLFDNLLSVTSITGLITFLASILAVSMITDEFNSGTIKLLLIRPIPRYKILLSKFLALFGYVLFYLSISIVTTVVVSLIFGELNTSSNYVYSIDSTTFGHDNFWLIFSQNILAQIFLILMISTIAFSLSVIFMSKSLALAFTLALYFVASPISYYASQYTDLIKYSWFANWDLKNYLSPFKYRQDPIVESMTLQSSIIIDFLYLIPIIVITFYVFQKKEII